MKTLDRILITIFVVVMAVASYGNYRHREATDALTKANLLLIQAIERAARRGTST